MSGRIAVVDSANRFLRWADRRTIHEQRLVHRSAYVLIFDSNRHLLVQRRHRGKQTYPRTWDISCAGHVEESDYRGNLDDDLDTVYAAVAARELYEELGVSPPLTLLGRFAPEPGVHYEQIHLFTGKSDGPYTLQADEVEEYLMLARDDVAAWLASPEPVTHTLRWFLGWLTVGERWP